MSELRLGNRYRYVITGMEGVASIRYDFYGSRTEVTIQPGVDAEGKMLKPRNIDPERLVDAASGKPVAIPPLPPVDIVFGSEYRDVITGFVGRCSARAHHINGCVQYALDGPVDEKGQQQGWYFDDDRLVDVAADKKAVAVPAPRGNALLTPSH